VLKSHLDECTSMLVSQVHHCFWLCFAFFARVCFCQLRCALHASLLLCCAKPNGLRSFLFLSALSHMLYLLFHHPHLPNLSGDSKGDFYINCKLFYRCTYWDGRVQPHSLVCDLIAPISPALAAFSLLARCDVLFFLIPCVIHFSNLKQVPLMGIRMHTPWHMLANPLIHVLSSM
jgi:hypothetical protein